MRTLLIAAVTLVGFNTPLLATTITFDDIAEQIAVPNGYGGLQWSNLTTEKSSILAQPGFQQPNGFVTGNVSGANVAFGGGAGDTMSFSSTTPFTLNSLYLTSAWRDDLSVAVTGKLNGVVIYTLDLVLNVFGPERPVLNWKDVDEVNLLSSGGVDHDPTLPGEHSQLIIDDISISTAVPELSAWAMMIVGFFSLGIVAQRRCSPRTGPISSFIQNATPAIKCEVTTPNLAAR